MSGRTNLKKPLTVSISILATLCVIAAGRTIYVDDDGPADFNNIQAAINDANEGDTIVVAEGRYFENINLGGKNIVLRSTDPDNPKVVANTVIDGGFRAHTVTFAGTETPDCILSGFTITRGRDTDHLDTLGGGIYGNGTTATIQYSFIYDNRALAWIMPSSALGGGLYDCDGIIQYNIISGNIARGQEFLSAGGGLYGCDGIIRNNVITGNWTGKGGGLFKCNGKITNCTISNNVGGGVFWCDGSITNCIIWANGDDLYRSSATFSCIENADEGKGNIHTDPCFVELGHWEDPCNTPHYPGDDMWINGDYHLKSQAGRWDEKEERWTKDDVTSPCIDAGDPMSPIGLERFPNGGRINIGAYGGTAEASKSYFGEPVCETIVAGDINGDCKVDFSDFVIMALHWLEDKSR